MSIGGINPAKALAEAQRRLNYLDKKIHGIKRNQQTTSDKETLASLTRALAAMQSERSALQFLVDREKKYGPNQRPEVEGEDGATDTTRPATT